MDRDINDFTDEEILSNYITFFLINNKDITFSSIIQSDELFIDSLRKLNGYTHILLKEINNNVKNNINSPYFNQYILTAIPWDIKKYDKISPIYYMVSDFVSRFSLDLRDIDKSEYINMEREIIINNISIFYNNNQKMLYDYLNKIKLYVKIDNNNIKNGYIYLLTKTVEGDIDKNILLYLLRRINNNYLNNEELLFFFNIFGKLNLNENKIVNFSPFENLKEKMENNIYSYPIKSISENEMSACRINPFTIEDFDKLTLNDFIFALVNNSYKRLVKYGDVLYKLPE